MKQLGTLLISFYLILAGCGPQRRPTAEEVILEAKSAAKIGVQKAKENSIGYRSLKGLPRDQYQKLAIVHSGTMPSSSISFPRVLRPKEKDKIIEMLGNYHKKISVFSYAPNCSTFGDTDPMDTSLLATDYYTKPTAGIIQVAKDLGSTEKIFNFVKNDIENEQTYGATQSANTLLLTKRGSVIDKANLLAALLRAEGTPVQFKSGIIYLTEPQAQRFFNAPYIGNVFLTISTVFSGYFTNDLHFSSEFYQIINGVKYILVPHVWLRVWDNGSWKNMDPTLVSDQLLPNRGIGLLTSSKKADLSTWFFGADAEGDYIKPKTLMDFLVETANLNRPITFINSSDSKTAMSYTDGIVSDLTVCETNKFNGVENSTYEFRGEIVVKNSSGAAIIKINQPLAKLSEDKSYLSHSAGLLSDLASPQSGNLEFKIGDQVIAQYATTAVAGNNFDLDYTTYYPFGYGVGKVQNKLYGRYTAGGVLVTHFFARPTTQGDIERETDILKRDTEAGASSKILMADVHRLAGVMGHFHESRYLEDAYKLRGIRWLPIAESITYTTQGRIVYSGNEKREFGFVPTMPVVDGGGGGPPVSVDLGAMGEIDGYEQSINAAQEVMATGSDYEAKMWEDVFGLKGYSTVRAFQIAGLSDSINPSTYNYFFFKGVEINSAGIALINSKIDPSSAFYAYWPQIQSIANPGLLLWATNKNIVDPENGNEMVSWFLIGGNIDNSDVAGARFSIVHYGSSYVNSFLNLDKSKNGNTEGAKFGNSGTEKSSKPNNVIRPKGGEGGSTPLQELDSNQGTMLALGPAIPGSASGLYSCNPVDFASGLMWHDFTDFNLRGHTPSTGLFFQRTYYTLPQYQTTGGWEDVGDLGKGWMHNFDTRLLDGSKDSSGNLLMGPLPNSAANILWITESGNTVLFSYDSGSGTYSAPTEFNGKLEISGTSYILTLQGNRKLYFKKDYSSNYNGRLLKIKDPHGEELTLTYDGNGRLSTITSPFAGDLVFTRDGNNKLIKIKSTKNDLEVNFGFTNGKLAWSVDFDGNQTTYQYNSSQVGTKANGLLTSFIDPLNRKISFEYYQNGKVYREVGLGNAVQTYEYAPYLYQKYTRVDAPSGQTTEYRYDNNFRVVLEVRPDGARVQRKWTSDGRELWETDGLGNKTEFTYDSRGNRTGVKRPLSSSYATATYDQTYDVPITTTPLVGGPSQMTLDPSTGGLTAISRYMWSQAFSINYTYDSFGTRLKTQNALNSYSDATNADGFVKLKFHSRNPSNVKYDSRGRMIEEAAANGRILHYTYDNFDRIISIDDTHGPKFRNFYDVGGRLTSRQRISGGTTQTATFNYDDRDRLISEVNFAGEKTSYQYDIVSVGCQIQDKPTKVIRADGTITSYKYDEMGRKIKETLPDGSIIQYGYNLRGDLISVMDPAGNLIQYEYDANQRLIKTLNQSAGWQQSVDGSKIGYMPEIISYSYDEGDRLLKKEQVLNNEIAQNGKYVTEFQYDMFDRVIQKNVTHKRGNAVVETFDQVSYKYYPILYPILVSEVLNKYAKLNFTYETQPPFNLVSYSQEPTAAGAAIGIEKHQYKVTPTQNGPIGSIARDGLQVIGQAYDPAGRLTSTLGAFNAQTNTATISYDGFARRSGISHTAGLVGTFVYDDADRVANIGWNGTPAVNESITYQKSGLASAIVREIGTFSYNYSPRDEVSSIGYSGSETLNSSYVNTSLSYDSAGNILTYRGTTFQNFNNFISQIGSSVLRPSSDGLGTMQNRYDGTNIQDFRYYPEGKLKKFRMFDSNAVLLRTVDYYYDGLGRRIAKIVTVPGQNTINITYSHLADEDKVLFAKYKQGSTAKEVLYVDGQQIDDHLFEISTDTGVKTYKKDHLGSILNSPAIGGKSVYGLFGENLGTAVSTSAYAEPLTYGFTGREYDNETGLYYYRARYYDPTTGRFLTKDPLGPEAGGDINPYRYAMNNPMNMMDPLGLWGLSLTTGWSAGASYSQTSTRGQVLEGSSGIALGTQGNGLALAGVVSRGDGTSINGIGASMGMNLTVFRGDVSSNAGPGTATTYLLGPFSGTVSRDASGQITSIGAGIGGKGLGIGSYTTDTTSSFGGAAVNSSGTSLISGGQGFKCPY